MVIETTGGGRGRCALQVTITIEIEVSDILENGSG